MQSASGHEVLQLVSICNQRNEVATVNAVLVASCFAARPIEVRSDLRCLARKPVTRREIAEHIRKEAVAGKRDLTALRVLLLRSLLPQSIELLARMRGRDELR